MWMSGQMIQGIWLKFCQIYSKIIKDKEDSRAGMQSAAGVFKSQDKAFGEYEIPGFS